MEKEIMYRIHGVTKSYLVGKKAMPALKEINFDIRKNELVAILGTSGCGKSTLLRMLAGFLKPTTGAIYAQHQAITGPGADRGMVFQSYTLFPWLTVRENVEYGLKELKVPKSEREATVTRYLHDVGLDGFENAYPRELSGEPFGALDAQTRSHMQEMMLDVWQKHPKTIVMVTHDIEEAIFMADRIVVMRAHPGSIKQVIDIDLPRDRDIHIKSDPRFIAYKEEILQLIYEESPAAQRQLMEA